MTGALVWAAVAGIGGLGALARFRLDGAIARRAGGDLPWGTWTVNVTGAFLAGLLAGFGAVGTTRTVLAVGALGSFTTFSTWILETQRLAEEGRGRLAAVNIALGLVSGLLAAAAGWGLGGLA